MDQGSWTDRQAITLSRKTSKSVSSVLSNFELSQLTTKTRVLDRITEIPWKLKRTCIILASGLTFSRQIRLQNLQEHGGTKILGI